MLASNLHHGVRVDFVSRMNNAAKVIQRYGHTLYSQWFLPLAPVTSVAGSHYSSVLLRSLISMRLGNPALLPPFRSREWRARKKRRYWEAVDNALGRGEGMMQRNAWGGFTVSAQEPHLHRLKSTGTSRRA